VIYRIGGEQADLGLGPLKKLFFELPKKALRIILFGVILINVLRSESKRLQTIFMTKLQTKFFLFFTSVGLLMGGVFFTSAEELSTFLSPIPDSPTINKELVNIDTIQYASKLDTNKYKFIPEKTIGEYKYTTHEYQTPDGQIGYQAIIETDTEIISNATGVEANDRTFILNKKDLFNYRYENN